MRLLGLIRRISSLFVFVQFLFFSCLAWADDTSVIGVKAQFRLRSEFREFTDTGGARNLFLLRQRTDLSFGKVKDLFIFVQPQFSKALENSVFQVSLPVETSINSRVEPSMTRD